MTIFAFLFFSLAAIQHIPSHDPHYNLQIIQPHEVGSNYQILKVTDEVFNLHQIPYWAWGGTLLGALRHGGFIPWDFDTDVCIFENDIDRLLACVEDLKKYDAYILPMDQDEKRTLYRIKRIKNGIDIYGHVDVFVMKKEEDQIVSKHKPYSNYYPNHFFLSDEINQLVRIAFGPIYVNAPIDPMPYLKRAFGADCLKMAEIMYTNNPSTGKKYPKFKIIRFDPAIYEVVDPSIPLDTTKLFN